jgi:hypothetical protein
MVFLATPHKGSQYAKMLNNILKATPNASAKVYVADLARNSSTLQDINEQFRHLCGELELISFHETKKTNIGAGFKRIVSEHHDVYPHSNHGSLLTKSQAFWDTTQSTPLHLLPIIMV